VYDFWNWFDERAWYPLGRIVGGTVYPGLMFTSGALHWLAHSLGIPLDIREICVFLAPLFRCAVCLMLIKRSPLQYVYGLCHLPLYVGGVGRGGGSLCRGLHGHWCVPVSPVACNHTVLCAVPGYISRSVAGSYDNESIAIFALMVRVL
jgi:dolichyl-diphosphooligosaccharide--protein glycosyltransferase